MSFVTFVIPTLGRETLARTIKSLVDQTDPDWEGLVVSDCGSTEVSFWAKTAADPRLWYCFLPLKTGQYNYGGAIRNLAIPYALGEWIGFVDDDDRLDHRYVEWLRAEAGDSDLFIFRMKYPGDDGQILPEGDKLCEGGVGISFALRRNFVEQQNLRFNSSRIEDWELVNHCLNLGAKVKISPNVAYYIRH